MAEYHIDFEPVGKRITVGEKASLLKAAQDAGISLTAICGGAGACKQCKVRCISGDLSKVQVVERETFSEFELNQGWRLACEAYPASDIKVEIPPESMTTSQRLQIEGQQRTITLDPAVSAEPFSLHAPGLDDLRSDWERFTDSFDADISQQISAALPVMRQFSSQMRSQNWSGNVIWGDGYQAIGFLAPGDPHFGMAVDIGTTKIAAFLVDLANGETIAQAGTMNPQISYGEDVVSRIAYGNQDETSRQTLQTRLIESLNELAVELCRERQIQLHQLMDFVVVGNTAMHHLFAGLPVRQLGEAPYVAAARQAIYFPVRDIGLIGAPGARVYLPPNIAGFVGADHVAMLLASDLKHKQGIGVALDIGTNTEISLSKDGMLVSCSCASGPAFEGAHIHDGMRAVPGAIERVQFYDDEWHVSTIGNEPPIGICGSGILDVVAGMLKSGQIDVTGRLTERASRRVEHPKGGAIILVPAEDTGTKNDLLVTRSDIREIQLAKAAIRAGVDALLRATDTPAEAIEHFIIAGAFGTYLNLESAIRIGMFPKLPRERYYQVGNAAGAGARQMLISRQSRTAAERILDQMTYIELTTDPGFMESYVDAMSFE